MIKIKTLEVNGFKLLDNAKISFENKQGIITLLGDNQDLAFDSNSSGKSTFPDSILQLLFDKNLQNISQKDVYNKYNGNKFSGKITFSVTHEEQETEVQVLKDYSNGTFDLIINDIIQEGKKPEKKKKLESLLGMSYETFSKLYYMSPTKLSLFSTNNDASQAKFITELLSLDFVTDINKKAKTVLDSYKSELTLKNRELDLMTNQMESLNVQLKLTPEKSKLDTTKIDTLKVKEQKLIESISELESLIKTQKQETQLITSEKDSLTGELKVSRLNVQDKERLLLNDTCPTCQQSLKGIQVKDNEYNNIKDLEKNLKETKTKVIEQERKLREFDNNLVKVNKELRLIEKEIITYNQEKELQQNNSFESLREKLREDLVKVSKEVILARKELNKYESLINVYTHVLNCTGAKGFKKERIGLFIKLLNRNLLYLCKELLGGEMIARVQADAKGNYNLVIQDTLTELSYLDLSSGFARRVDILLVLALNLSVEKLTQKRINLLILDECLSGVDSNGIKEVESLLQKVKEMFKEKSIVIVLHGNEVQSDYTLVVKRENNTSKLHWA